MGFIPRLARGFSLVFLAAGSAAQAEVMHMPFDCRADGAGVQLRPAPERTYTIIGRHEREIFTACSPTEPDTCRNWYVHRFEFDCGGDRVAWIDAAVAAARFTDWDAWIEGGRFRMRMNRLWGVARAGPFGQRRRRMRRHFRDRDDPFARGPERFAPRVVTVRPGFAPAVGIPLTFSGGAPEVSELPAQGAPAVAGYAAKPVPAPVPELPERAPSKAERIAAASAPPVVAPAPKLVNKATATQQTPSMSAPTDKAPTKPRATKNQGFTIINSPGATADEPKVTPSSAAEARAGAMSESIETAAVTAPAEERTQPRAPSAATPSTDAAPVASKVVPSEVPPQPRIEFSQMPPEAAAAAAATTLALAGLAVFGLWRWRRRSFDAPPVNRDIADISLDGGAPAPRLALGSAELKADAPASESLDHPSGDDEADANALPVPTTYAEALELLGASADASTGAIKKIVDGLRQSWHPDLARSEADRCRREARVRQINVAWDLVSQNRSAA